jgi:hypothetical protein
MHRFLAEFLFWVIVWSIEHFFTKVSPGRVAKKKLQRLIERSRKLEDAKE